MSNEKKNIDYYEGITPERFYRIETWCDGYWHYCGKTHTFDEAVKDCKEVFYLDVWRIIKCDTSKTLMVSDRD